MKEEKKINQVNDWHLSTQNSDYLELSKKRLSEPILIWVDQFTRIINNNIKYIEAKSLTINDIGCNVGHFARNLKQINRNTKYRGIDISQTYLKIAKEFFPNLNFFEIDFSQRNINELEFNSDLTVVSATLEHVENYSVFLENIFNTTTKNVIIRTFLGSESKKEYCHKNGAANEYLIRQFQINDIVDLPFINKWSFEIFTDEATNSEVKKVCGNIVRKQYVINFIKRNQNFEE